MTATTRIRRGAAGRLTTKASVSSRSRRRANPNQKGLGARIIAALPFNADTIQKFASAAIVLLILAMLWGVAVFFGLPGMVWQETSQLAARAGFQVEKVEVHGTEHMDEQQVYSIALGQVDRSMLNLDLPGLRTDLIKLSWVRDARISRRLPDTLVVDVVERQPVAVWQNAGKLALIDVTGSVLDTVKASSLPDLPLVVGPRANAQTGRLTALMDAAPSLKPVLAAATWVGNRRWDLRFQSGETLSLPEGDEEAAAALVNFTRMDGTNRLLGRGILRFDMRDPDKMILRMRPETMHPDQRENAKPGADDDKAATRSDESRSGDA